MCGITGIISFTEQGKVRLSKVHVSNDKISSRGPDGNTFFTQNNIALGHRRLSIIDTSDNASQPMTDPSNRYTIIFNGEIFNFRELKKRVFSDKNDWHSQSDTEVLLHLFIKMKQDCLQYLHGFFAFAVYDAKTEELFIARDRFGKKPVHYYKSDEFFAFASEMKGLFAYDIPKELNHTALLQYLQFNYVPQPHSIINGVQKLAPGHYMVISKTKFETAAYYQLQWQQTDTSLSYEIACEQLEQLMEKSVTERLISDVPLGAFLSGGIDSSVVVALASRHVKNLNTFSIGYKDNSFFDETSYANLVAKKYTTNHTVFSLTNQDLLENIDNILAYIDEPFADSSAIPVYILSKHTRKYVTVGLSGDGGDEVFAGYNKQQAEWRIRQHSFLNTIIKTGSPLWKLLPQSRNNKFTNFFRQLNRFADGVKLNAKERYWRWAGFLSQQQAMQLLSSSVQMQVDEDQYLQQKNFILRYINGGENLEDFLATDMDLVLLSDMLVKVDLMSMANSLEIRSPFLSHEVVDFAFKLPTSYKVDKGMKKKIVQDTFRKYLPEEIYNRPKHGFEIPLLDWFRKELRSKINEDWLDDGFIAEQGLFNVENVKLLKQKLFSNNPGDAHATTWALIVFQNWWKNYFE
ncbi:MAG TPA: asparagine synthase (glutamine-hydrolyzing) [Chitinophagaceae bacterium]|nr:asparagine synthase (glutamine-hydrolyzing) [Chitinophagaceae bacterium]